MMAEAGKKVAIYKPRDGGAEFRVKLEQESVWLNQKQMANLFLTERSVITRHIKNIIRNKELQEKSVCAKFAHTAEDGKTYQVNFYNLDMIISVGYRVNSKRGTQFRIWATRILKEHLVKGYTANEKRLRERADRFEDMQKTIGLMGHILEKKTVNSDEATGLLRVISDYSHALTLLDHYDRDLLGVPKVTRKKGVAITYEKARPAIDELKKKLCRGRAASDLFGVEKGDSFKSALLTVEQTFDGKFLYQSLEEKAANLLYLVIKDHPFVDGNKRIAAFLFVRFMDMNGLLYSASGHPRIAANALVALTLLIAESNPKNKDVLTRLVVNLINRKNSAKRI